MNKFIKIPRFMVLFTLYLILTWSFEFMGSSLLMHYESVNSLVLVLLILIGTIILVGFLNIVPANLIKIINKNLVYRIITSLYLIISIIFSLFLLILTLDNWFYMKTPFFILLLLFVGVIFLIHQNLRFIFYLGFFLGILFLIPNILPFFCANGRNFDFLTFIDFKFSNFMIIFSCFYLLLDLLIYLPINIQLEKPISKQDLLIIVIFSGLSAFFMMADNYFFLLPDAFIFFKQPALLKYRIYQLDPIGESLDFLIIIDLIYLIIIKNSLSLFLFKSYQGIKKKQLSYLVLILLIIVGTIVLYYMDDYYLVCVIFSAILSVLMLAYYIILQIIYLRRKKNGKKALL